MAIKVDKHTVIVFDLDDTLYNEIDYLKSAYKFISKQMTSENHNSLYSRMFTMYKNGEDVFQFLSEQYNIEKQEILNTYRNHKPDIQLFEGALDLIQTIKNKDGKIAIITDGRVKTQTAKIEALGIDQFLSKVVISEAIGTEKPNVLNYETIEDALPARVYYYIADNIKKDFVTPNALGWKTIGLKDNGLNIHTSHPSDVAENFLPQTFIESLRDLKVI